MKSKVKISAVVVSYNEAHLLDRCLVSLTFCEEIILIDLESTDNSISIAKKYNAKVFTRPRVPFVEINQHWIVDKVENDWVLYIDPDEVVDPILSIEIAQLLPTLDPDICQIELPWQFYYKKKPLRGTTWGGENYKGILIHKDRINVEPISQVKFSFIEGYSKHRILKRKNNVLHHYWMQNFKSLLEKHNRYIRIGKQQRFKAGERFTWKKLLITPIIAFKGSFIDKKGYRDGFIGLFLSLFWSWYCFKSVWVLKELGKNGNS